MSKNLKPLFNPGDSVYHLGVHVCKPKKKALVVECINFDDLSDVKAQGFRYIVRHSGFHWAVPEEYLAACIQK